jgi:NAD(P)-dependent dehydrogenase (short-subunit alcohol dehydrogenase family)
MSVALVTGAGSGIGAAVALLAAERGHRVAAMDVDDERAEATARLALERGAPASLALAADVADADAVARAVTECTDALGVPTAVLANAGIERNGRAHQLPLADWDAVLAVNLTGAFLTARAAIAALLDADAPGSIVVTSSPAAFLGFAGGGNTAYAASKGGLSAMVRSLAVDYAPRGIRVNAIVPGATDTPLLVAHLPEGDRGAAHAAMRAKAREQIPLARMGTPEEIAEAALWLWSDAASYVTGSHLVCDGGLLARSANTF